MNPFATTEDLMCLAGNLGNEKFCIATQYLSVVSDCLREAADQVGKDLDVMIKKSPWLGNIARAVTLEVAVRAATSFSFAVKEFFCCSNASCFLSSEFSFLSRTSSR